MLRPFRRYIRYPGHLVPSVMFVPYAPPADRRPQPPLQRRRANRWALVVFALVAVAGLLLKYR